MLRRLPVAWETYLILCHKIYEFLTDDLPNYACYRVPPVDLTKKMT